MLRLNKTFNSFNVIGDQWTPYTYTKNRKEEWSQSRIFLFDLSSTLSFIGWSTQSAVARGGGTRGQKRLDYEQSLIFRLSHGDREHVTLRVKGEERWRKPEWRKKFLSPAPSLLLFTINLHSLFRSPRVAGKKDDRSRAVKKKVDKITSNPPTRAICTTVPRLESIKKLTIDHVYLMKRD